MANELLDIYKSGMFPMADSVDSPEVYLVAPEKRGLLPIADLHISKSLLKALKKRSFEVYVDRDFPAVIAACAEETDERPSSWINPAIQALFVRLHEMGHAHSVECYYEDALVGGLYGLQVGSIFCGESMFSRRTDASKVALVHLCARLWKVGFDVLDSQFTNDHLKQFGCYEIPNNEYQTLLIQALGKQPDFSLSDFHISEQNLVQEYLENRHF